MRNITSGSALHNHRAVLVIAPALVLALALAAAGCRDHKAAPPSPAEQAPATTTAATDDGGLVDVSAVTAWEQLARRLRAGERPDLAEYQRLFSLPGQALAYDQTATRGLKPYVLRNCSEAVFHPEGCLVRKHPKRKDVMDNLAFLKPRLDALDTLLTTLRERRVDREILALAGQWVPAGRLPPSLAVRLFVGTPSMRYDSTTQSLLVDAGLALASGPDQLVRMAAANLYRYFVPLQGPEPARAANGALAAAAALEKLTRDGVAGWIEDYADQTFPPDHPLLGRTATQRAGVVSRAAEALPRLADMVKGALADPAELDRNGYAVERYLRLGNRYTELGYAMAALVADRLGESALHAAAADPVAFLDTYQRAAAEADAAPGQLALLEPFPGDVRDAWADLYRREFPGTTRE